MVDRDQVTHKGRLREIALIFLRLGATAFGGPAAHTAMMEEEIVRRRKWITHEYFLDMLGATNIIPGPNSTEMAIHIGYVRGGWRGLVIAGLCFIFPAFVITLIFASLYAQFGAVPQVARFVWGIRGAVIVLILAALVRLGKPALKKRFMLLVGGVVCGLNQVHVSEIALLFAAGAAGLAWGNRQRIRAAFFPAILTVAIPAPFILSFIAPSIDPFTSPTLLALSLLFLKIGSILYGSGYVLVAFLQGTLVESHHWLAQSQLLDAIAVGQFTPGPVLSTATFVGYLLLGFPGAVVSTVAIFLPSFVFVSMVGPHLAKLRTSATASGFLDGVNAASLGLMLSVCISLGISTLTGVGSCLIFLVSAAVVLRNLHPAWVVLGAAVLGWGLSLFGILT